MGQRANSGRRANLDDKKTRAAGRQPQSVRGEIRDRVDEQFAKGKTGGAGGKDESINTEGGSFTRGGGGGGGASSRPAAAPQAGKTPTRRSSRPARKRG